eukprot:COSAG01_NODE_44850_length_415_cov_0.598101_1_plen_20_part_10
MLVYYSMSQPGYIAVHMQSA